MQVHTEAMDPLQLDSHGMVSHSGWVQGTELRISLL